MEETLHPMSAEFHDLEKLEDLRNFVYQILCDRDHLEPGSFHMTERILTRRAQPCGTLFCLHGPRDSKITAIWETDHNTILFYDSSGQRFHRARLSGPAGPVVAAA